MEYGLIGSRLGHSYSKIIHQRLCGYDYQLLALPTEAEARRFLEERPFRAVNVTIPYKRLAMDACDQVDPRAAAIGAVNTVVNRDGRLYGYNTDYAGFGWLARRHDVRFTGKTVMILGTGGTSNTVSARYCDGIMRALSEEVTRQGYAYYDWNATNGDGDTGLSADALVAQAKREIGSQEVVMLLMHDGAGNEASVEALPEILRYCQEQGYEFRVIDETTPQFHHHINN